ncbi:MAG TPA: SsrA-binding protein SmpB [Gemmatimonadales bacterium]|nr:SsrA-binding protein SmpB [Gemmatimonadales bacterium]
MSRRSEPERDPGQVLARNPKARHDYHILETWEGGLVLTGTEVKSVRAGRVSLKEAFGVVRRGEVWIEGMHVAPYESSGYASHDPVRSRKLLLHRREIRRLIGSVEQRGLTLIPLDIHLNRGRAKVTLALARGKKLHDKREDLRRRDAEREVARAMSRRA